MSLTAYGRGISLFLTVGCEKVAVSDTSSTPRGRMTCPGCPSQAGRKVDVPIIAGHLFNVYRSDHHGIQLMILILNIVCRDF